MRSFEKGKVSIITPCYNGEQSLDRYFDSICKQTYDNVQVIIVNDGSTDKSEKICLLWKSRVEKRGYEFQYVLLKTNIGLPGAINAGLPYISGEFLTWSDCDDTLMPTSLEKKVEFLNLHPDYAMVRSNFVSVHETNPDVIMEYGSDSADVQNEDIFDNLITEKTFCTAGCYMVRSSILFERIPHGEIYWENRGGQNWQLLLPCSYKNITGYIDDPLLKYYISPNSHSHRIDGDEYSHQKRRILDHREILFNVINGFHLLSDSERVNYLNKIELKYIKQKLDTALLYNKSDDAKIEMHELEKMNFNPGTLRKILYLFCNIKASGSLIKGYSSLCNRWRYFHTLKKI